jgi:two-component system sensor histidine kinase/response regulator
MSFRLKTILGVAVIEALLLLLLIASNLQFLRESNQEQLLKRATTTANLFVSSSKDALLASDLATLDSIVAEGLSNPEVLYVRIFNRSSHLLAEAGHPAILIRPFVGDSSIAEVDDGVFDLAVTVSKGGIDFGRIELGLSITSLEQVVTAARRWSLSIAAFELLLVALFSAILGAYLTRRLSQLETVADRITQGEMGIQLEIAGQDEVARVGMAFNRMSERLAELYEEVEHDQRRLRAILETMLDGIVTINEKGVIETVNPSICRMFGYEEGALIGKKVNILMSSPHAENHDHYIERYLGGGQARVIGSSRELLARHRSGQLFPVGLSVSEMELGGQCYFVGVLRDLTAAKEAGERLRRTQALKSAMLESALDGVITIDHDGKLLEFNPAAEAIFGFHREEVIGQRLVGLIIPERFREAHEQGIKRYLESGSQKVMNQRIELSALHARGHEFPVEIAITPIHLDDRPVFTAYLRDISQRRADQQTLLKAKEEAEAASHAKSDFLAVMSHEIRTPMNAILGSLTLLEDEELTPTARSLLANAHGAGKGLLWLINDILDFSKIEAGRLMLEPIPYRVPDLADETVALLAERARNKGIELVSVIDPLVPLEVIGDVGRLRQILINLIGNAIKFTHEGGVSLNLRLSESGWLIVTVSDSGIGIEPSQQRRLFEEFVQVQSSYTRQYGGTGLGLAICRRLVRLMGGEIGLSSEPGLGSCFWFEIPIETIDHSGVVGIPDGLPHRAAVTISNRVVRSAIEQQLTSWGVAIVAATDPECEVVIADESFSGEPPVGRRLVRLVASRSAVQTTVEAVRPVTVESLGNLLTGRAPATREESDSAQPAAGPHGSGRILLAEDSQANQIVAVTMLERAGYEVDVAANGAEAVEAVRNHPYDLILMDLSMPEMDGLEATRRIIALRGGGTTGSCPPIVAMTANVINSDLARCREAGMIDVVTKPVVRQNLLETVARIIDRPEIQHDESAANQQPTTEPATEEELISRAVIQQLVEETSQELVPRLLEVYIEESRERVEQIVTAVESGDIGSVYRQSHALKSSSGSIGAIGLQQLAASIESLTAHDGSNGQLPEGLISQLTDLHSRSIEALQQLVDSWPAD